MDLLKYLFCPIGTNFHIQIKLTILGKFKQMAKQKKNLINLLLKFCSNQLLFWLILIKLTQ